MLNWNSGKRKKKIKTNPGLEGSSYTHTHTQSLAHTHTHTQSLATTGKLKNTIKKHIFQHAYMHERQHYPICGMLCHIAMV